MESAEIKRVCLIWSGLKEFGGEGPDDSCPRVGTPRVGCSDGDW